MRSELTKINLEIENTEAKLLELKRTALQLNSSNKKKEGNLNISSNTEDSQRIKVRLEEKEKLFQKTEEFFNVGRWIYYFKDKSVEWSDETYKIFEYPDNYKGSLMEFYMSCIDDETVRRLSEMGGIFIGADENRVINQTIVTPLGNKKLLSFSSTPIYSDAGEIVALEGLVKDLSDKVTGKNGLDNFFNLSFDLHCIVHMDRHFLKVSPSWTKLLGYSEKELLSRSFMELVHPDDMNKTVSTIHDLDVQGAITSFENRYLTKSGNVVYLSWHSRLDEETQLAYCTARDITQSKIAQDELLSDLSEKELLLREIHHRVKNNLQIISSLLSLQAGANSEEKHLNKLYEDSQNRIKSMAAIHEMFYQSDELDKIDFNKYMDKLTGDLSRSFNSLNKTIDFNLNVEPVYVNLDTAIPLGLLINEVVTNSIKHGGDIEGNVRIFIDMVVLNDNRLQLIIGDNGVQSQDDILNQTGGSLGVLLINSLVEQVDGEIEQLKNYEGTVFKLIFKNRLNRKL